MFINNCVSVHVSKCRGQPLVVRGRKNEREEKWGRQPARTNPQNHMVMLILLYVLQVAAFPILLPPLILPPSYHQQPIPTFGHINTNTVVDEHKGAQDADTSWALGKLFLFFYFFNILLNDFFITSLSYMYGMMVNSHNHQHLTLTLTQSCHVTMAKHIGIYILICAWNLKSQLPGEK